MLSASPKRLEFVLEAEKVLKDKLGPARLIDRNDLLEVTEKTGLSYPSWLSNKTHGYVAARGEYYLPVEKDGMLVVTAPNQKTVKPATNASPVEPSKLADECFSVKRAMNYVPWGHHKTLETIIASRKFYPTFITGLSGNGKTFMVEQICAKLKRAMYRVNITIETDEDDLIGGFRLQKGETVWSNGPVIDAMLTGSILLLDEIDLGSTKLLALQPVLEGNGIFIKKINKWVRPTEGFNIVATANTKGRGDDSGKFIGANILNEAFLERFPITLEQPYPTNGVEKKILTKHLTRKCGWKVEKIEKTFIEELVQWSHILRKSYEEGVSDDLITTRRLVHIIEAYTIFKDTDKSLELAINRFPETVKSTFIDVWEQIHVVEEDDTLNTAKDVKESESDSDSDLYVPF